MPKAPKGKGFVNIKKVMGPRGSLHKALGVDPSKNIGPAKLRAVAAGGGKNAKKAALALRLHREGGKSGK